MTRRRIAGCGISTAAIFVVAVLFLLAEAFVPGPPHEVHTTGALAINASLVVSKPPNYNQANVRPSESLDEIRCQLWLSRRPPSSNCPDSASLASMYFSNLAQSPSTLYFPWHSCLANFRGWNGFNVEYRPGNRTLVIHCYYAEPWLYRQPVMMGVLALQPDALLLVPTASLPIGTVTIVEDDRVEHLVGDTSDEFQLATAAIS